MEASTTSKIPTFQTKRLILKEVTLQDIPAYAKHFIDYEVIRHLSHKVPWPYPEDGIEGFLQNVVFPGQGKNRWFWGIFMKDNPGELIGCVDLWREGTPEHRGFWLGRKYWGKGIMTEAVYPVLDYAFDRIGFEKLIFTNAVGNIGSRRVKEKTGCKLIGTQPARFVDPSYTESELWELTKESWKHYKSSTSFVAQ